MQCLGHIQLAKLHYIISQNSSCLRILKYYFSYKTNVLCLQQYILTSECLSTSISTSRYYVAHLICSLENECVGKCLFKPEINCLLFKQRCQIQTLAKDQNIGLFRQFICCLQNFGSDKTAWKVNKEFPIAIEFCLH